MSLHAPCTRAAPILSALVLLAGCSTVPTAYNPPDPLPPQAFSYQAFNGVLKEHVADGVVDYPAVAQDPRLQVYLGQLDRFDPTRLEGRQDRLAFWINIYNAFAIQGILDGLSPLTWTGKYRYFVAKTYRVGGAELNLYGLEHKILIPMGEPRVHFAIVCASRSCPALRSEAYAAERLDAQLEEEARRFVNDPHRNRFDRANRVAYLSRIFKWYRADFESVSGSLLDYVAGYVDDPELARDLRGGRYRVEFLEYDWRTNGPLPESV